MARVYLVTDGRHDYEFPYTDAGLRAAWECRRMDDLRVIQVPHRVDLDYDGLTEDDREQLDIWDNEEA